MKKKIAVIGSGFSGLSAAAYLAKAGHEVHVFEKHGQPGGRARQFVTPEGFVFDMGPSWYWMPDVIDGFFGDFGYKTDAFFKLIRLNPQFEMVFSDGSMRVPDAMDDLKTLFEQTESGAGVQLERFMQSAKFRYQVSMADFVRKPSHRWLEFASTKMAKNALRLNLLTNFRSYVGRYFKNEKLRTLMEFPVIFLGASPKNIPAMYSLMNYGGYALGTHYPMGGFYQLVLAMQQVAEQQGAAFHFNKTVERIHSREGFVDSLTINGEVRFFDTVVASSDYHHTETLLDPLDRNYSESYWERKTFAPSSLIFYLGIDQKLPDLKHHTLFFENDLDAHIESIY